MSAVKEKQLQNLVYAMKKCCASYSDSSLEKLRETLSEFSKIANTVIHQKNYLTLTDCLVSLVELLTKTEYPCDIREQAVQLLHVFAQDDDNKLMMEEQLSLTRNLLSALGRKQSDNLKIQILKLLQTLTYGSTLSWLNAEDKYGLRFVHIIIDTLIERSDNAMFEFSMGILVNLCKNTSVQSYVANIEQFSRLKSLLLHSLNTDNLCIILYSMSLIFALSSSSEKVFATRNIHQTFEVIFNSLVNRASGWTPFYAADLLMELAKASRTRVLLENYQYLSACLNNVLSLICQKERRLQFKLLQLLLTFCEVSDRLRRTVSDLIFSHELVQSDSHFLRLLDELDAARKEGPLFTLCYLVMNENTAESEMAARVLRETHEDLLQAGQKLNPRLILIDRTLSRTAVACPSGTGRENIRLLKKWSNLLNLMTVLLDHEEWYAVVSQPSHKERVEQLVRAQLSGNPISTSLRLPSGHTAVGEDPTLAGACLVLRALHFMYVTVERNQKGNPFEASLTSLLQDPRLAPILAYGIVGGNSENVQLALELTSAALLMEEFSVSSLGEHINTFSQELRRTQVQQLVPSFTATASSSLALRSRDENRVPEDIDAAVERLVSGLQSDVNISDSKTSDLLAVYEHKLQTLQTKESHLEDLLSTKTMALAQADALIVKYRSRLSIAETENQKLRCLLLEYEREGERRQEMIRRLEHNFEEAKKQKSQVNAELKRSHEEVRKLKGSLQETTTALKKSAEKAKRLQEEVAAKTRNIEELDKNIDSYRSRLDEAEQTIRDKTRQLTKFSEVTKLINSLTVDPAAGESMAAALQSSNPSGSA